LNLLVAGARSLGVDLESGQLAAFQSYFLLLEQRGRLMNLTAVRGWEDVREELFLRSLRVLAVPGNALQEAIAMRGEGVRVADVGTGAGIPGLVLKLALPRLDITMIEATQKKAEFLREAIAILKLDRTRVVNARAEAAAHAPDLREAFDVVVARALAQLPELAELTLPFARVGGSVIAPKGAGIEAEVRAAAYAATMLGAAPSTSTVVSAPGSRGPDTMVVWDKNRKTPDRYPRRVGVPHKQPLQTPGQARRRAP